VGTPCAKAKDPTRCADAFAHAKGTTGGEWLVWTRGDDVGAVGGKAAVSSFLAPIDTPQDAAAGLVYSLAEGNSAAAVLPPCDPSTFRAVADGYETDYVLTMLCHESVTTRYHVAHDGTVTSNEVARTPRDPNCQPPVLVPRARVGAHGARSLESIAIENAVEGCVNETWAALVATLQAAHATDPELRAVMSSTPRAIRSWTTWVSLAAPACPTRGWRRR
jgi:hypothetical protein